MRFGGYQSPSSSAESIDCQSNKSIHFAGMRQRNDMSSAANHDVRLGARNRQHAIAVAVDLIDGAIHLRHGVPRQQLLQRPAKDFFIGLAKLPSDSCEMWQPATGDGGSPDRVLQEIMPTAGSCRMEVGTLAIPRNGP